MSAGKTGYIVLGGGDTPDRDRDGRVLNDASHVQQYLASRRGVSTVVVPPSTPGGTPEGFDPHMNDDTVINYDPGRPNASSYTVSQLRMQQMGSGLTGAVKSANSVVAGSVIATSPSNAYAAPVESVQHSAAPAGLRPLEAIHNARRQTAVVAPVRQPLQPTIITVNFEVEGFGVFQAPYDSIILKESMLVLVFDHAIGGRVCYFPDFKQTDASQQPPEIAMQIDGEREVYMIHTTGIRFRHGTLEYCVVLIGQTVGV